ncbi:MAG: hypothetical protein ABR990_11230 [Terracidiphilus sp.]|jgi:glucan phosphoethanolaminetransferase (alkaline phosphatase superfamily)
MPTLQERLRSILCPRPGQAPSLFQASATVFSISAVYLYFAGYVFCYFYYYQGFGVTLESLDLSTQFYFVRAYTCLRSVGGLCLLLALLLVIAAYLRGLLRSGITLLAMLATFPLLFYVSYHTAWMEQQANFCSPASTIQFRFKERSGKTPAADAAVPATTGDKKPSPETIFDSATSQELMALGQSGELSLLLETKDRIIVFKKPNCYLLGDNGPMMPPKAHVYTLLRSDLEFTEVMP